jgi:hypothetical protein
VELLDLFLGKNNQGRNELILEATSRTALRKGDWVLIPPYPGRAINTQVNIELGNAAEYQLYNLKDDLGEQNNLAESNEEKLKEMIATFEEIRGSDYGQIQQLELK